MSTAHRRAEFFALEAREYLAELEPVLSADSPDLERLVRGARALRGAALMAGLGTFARAAAGLEALARRVRDHGTPWAPGARAAWQDGLQTLRELTERAPSWEAADDRAALALADRIEQATSGSGPRVSVPATPALTPGVRAFIARESAMIAGSLEEAARALAPVPPQAALAAVLERMRALRGLGGSAELSPLPELLDAMEMATRTLLSDVPPPPDVATLFADAAHVLAAMARSMTDEGRVEQPRELAGLAEAMLASYAGERDVVAIADLAPEGGESLLRLGTPPLRTGESTPIALELVGVGDHLLEAADRLQRSPSSAAANLRLFVLHRTLATMPPRSPTGRFLAPLAQALTAAIGGGLARGDRERFVGLVREAGKFLTHAGNSPTDESLLGTRDRLASTILFAALHATPDGSPAMGQPLLADPWQPPALDAAEPPTIAVMTFTPDAPPVVALEPIATDADAEAIVSIESLAPDDDTIVSIESLAPDSDTIVSIESLAPDDDTIVSIESLAPDDDAIVPIESLAPAWTAAIPAEAPGTPGRLEVAYRALSLVTATRGGEEPSIDALLGRDVLPIEQLLYRGASALQRAAQVREEINGLLAEPTVSLDRLRPYIQELLDLVPLARDAA
ncbi:MAG: Hpt domain-containing protein [Gemmatimonadales bacterium]|nr:Hpt domain-containing protein [Gemmatimonadales bacterium]